jgi:hypothetical protein
MTDINTTLKADDLDTGRQTLDEAGDRWRVEDERKAFAREQGLRQALATDIEAGRDWATDRATLARTRIRAEPLKASLYALGAGVLIGLVLRR